jgi:hypothetical protein
MKKNVDLDKLITDSLSLSSSISALSKMSYEQLILNTITLEDINEINAIIVSIQCLAEQHAQEMEAFGLGKL